MITKDYNPSPLEVKFVEVLCDLKDQINKRLENFDVFNIENNTQCCLPRVWGDVACSAWEEEWV